MGRISGDRCGVLRFFIEVVDPEILVHVDHAESIGLFDRNIDRADDGIGPFGEQPVEHLRIVHLVDVVAGEDENIVGLFGVEQEQVLVHRVGGALVPFLADPLLGRNRGDVFAEFGVQNVPSAADVPVERVRFVLNENGDFRRRPEFRQLLSVKSIIRYFPPKGTAGLARCSVRGERRSPLPPASIIVKILFIAANCNRTVLKWKERGMIDFGNRRDNTSPDTRWA